MRLRAKNTLLRPITGRALQTVGDSLRPYCFEANVLDAFAGSGRLGMLALKEGASRVTFVENHVETARKLKESLKAHRWETRSTVVISDAVSFLKHPVTVFDIVFADPPFDWWNVLDDEVSPKSAKGPRVLQIFSQVVHADSILFLKLPRQIKDFKAEIEDNREWGMWKMSEVGSSLLVYFKKK